MLQEPPTTEEYSMAMTVVVERITPSRAEKMLNRNCDNRVLRSGLVEKYAADMAGGKWTNCTDPIAFYENGDVADGQHRLWAVVESKTTQTFIIARGLTKEDGLNIDVGFGRTLVDNARIAGVDMELSNRLIAVARVVATGSNPSYRNIGMSNSQKLAMVNQHREACVWAIANGPSGRHFSHSLVLGAVARAWYYEDDKVRLAHFCDVLGKGFMADESESAAIAIRNYLIEAARTGHGHPDVWRDSFFKVQNAIRYFMKRRKIIQIRTITEEPYPLPKEKGKKKAA